MAAAIECSCKRCTIRGMMGPAILITLGLLFLLGETRGWGFSFGRTWPVVLIVSGAINLISALSSTEGHIGTGAPVAPAPQLQPPAQGPGH
jgi:hypothetical protein